MNPEGAVMAGQRSAIPVLIAFVVLIFAAGCTADRIALTGSSTPTVRALPPVVVPVRCSGSGGDTPLRGLFADLDAGRTPDVGTYFVDPLDFVRWWDPTLPSGQVISFEAGDGSGTATLDTLQSHLDALRRRGVAGTVSVFTATGYDAVSPQETGGSFTFSLRARATHNGPLRNGGGEGTIDCANGRLKSVVIDRW
jgi:hypothetical protein